MAGVSLESFEAFSTSFPKTFRHQPCIVINVTQSNLPPSPWSGDGNRNTQLCCQPHFDPLTRGGRYEIAFYDNGYAYYEELEGARLLKSLERYNPQMEFQSLTKVLARMKQILEDSASNSRDNQISVQLVNDDSLVVEIKGTRLSLSLSDLVDLTEIFAQVSWKAPFSSSTSFDANDARVNSTKPTTSARSSWVSPSARVANSN